jgi:hypothetical protein
VDGPVGVVVEVGISHHGLIIRGFVANTPGQVRGASLGIGDSFMPSTASRVAGGLY